MQNNIELAKSEIRKIYKTKRANFSHQEIKIKSEKINQNFLQNLLPKIYPQGCNKVFSVYLASNKEVATDIIIANFITKKIAFSYPKIVVPNHFLEFIAHNFNQENQDFLPNKFFPKILEPNYTEKVLPDILILPLLAFDSDLMRLGMGGGFFDRTIEFLKSKKKIITIGLAFDEQKHDEELPRTKNDQTLDFIVSEKDIFSTSREII